MYVEMLHITLEMIYYIQKFYRNILVLSYHLLPGPLQPQDDIDWKLGPTDT